MCESKLIINFINKVPSTSLRHINYFSTTCIHVALQAFQIELSIAGLKFK